MPNVLDGALDVKSGQTTLAVIGFGSNLGQGQELIRSAWKRLTTFKNIVPHKLSSLYATEAVGMTSSFLFTNGVGLVETRYDPHELLHCLLQVEAEHGRLRDPESGGYQDRFLDLDLLYFGDTILNTPQLRVPHPHIGSRLFVLAPLVEIAPELLDPLTGSTVTTMYQQLLLLIQQGEVKTQSISRLPKLHE